MSSRSLLGFGFWPASDYSEERLFKSNQLHVPGLKRRHFGLQLHRSENHGVLEATQKQIHSAWPNKAAFSQRYTEGGSSARYEELLQTSGKRQPMKNATP